MDPCHFPVVAATVTLRSGRGAFRLERETPAVPTHGGLLRTLLLAGVVAGGLAPDSEADPGTAGESPSSVVYVANAENVTVPQVRYSAAAWKASAAGYLKGRGAGNRLFGIPPAPAGDFRVDMEIALPEPGKRSRLLIGQGSEVLLASGDSQWRLRGSLFEAGGRGTAVSVDPVAPGRIFAIVLARSGGELTLSVDGRSVYRGPCVKTGLGEVGLDPDEGVVRLYTFRATGRFSGGSPGARKFGNRFGMQLRPTPESVRQAWAPAIVREAPSNECSQVARRDGALEIYFITKPESDSVSSIRSEDGGRTWSAPRVAFAIPGRAYYAVQVIAASDGGLHAVFHIAGQGEGGYRGRLYDVYHCRQDPGTRAWTTPRKVVPGYVGSLRGFIQLRETGRLVLTVSSAVPERASVPAAGPDFGWHDVYAYVSDDSGETWQRSPDPLRLELKTPNVTRYGAVEPTVLELRDGRIWMLVRDRQGRLWQSFSGDGGLHWRALEKSPFISSDSPAHLLRLRDGRILLFTNACQFWENPRSYAMGGREVLHAAISADEGRTWRGFREILNETDVVTGGDRGTAYPSAAETREGKVVVVSGQGEGKRAILLFDPRWLDETTVCDDLGRGPAEWTRYGGGTIEVRQFDGEPALAIPLQAGKPAGASWNFPMTDSGELTLRMRLPDNSGTVRLLLNDHFTRVDDMSAFDHAVFTADVQPGRAVGDGWHSVRLAWTSASGGGPLAIEVDGRPTGHSRAVRRAQFGVNYLRVDFSGESSSDALLLRDLTVRPAGLPGTGASSTAVARVAGGAGRDSVLGNGAAGAFDSMWVGCPSVVVSASGYRMWYSSSFTPDAGPVGIGVARSVDGINWHREGAGQPVFLPGGAGAFDSACVMGPEVGFDGHRYLMWYTGSIGTKHPSGFFSYRIGVASSLDGTVWTRENGGRPVIDLGPTGSPDEVQAATPSVLRESDGYRMWYAAWAPRSNHTICVARSRDGISWERENGGRSVEGLNPATAFGPAVCRSGSDYVMLYMSLATTRAIYAAASSDGLHWRMLNAGRPVIVPSGHGFDANVAGHPWVEKTVQGYRIWYTGYDTSGSSLRNWRLRIGLAEVRFPIAGGTAED